MAKKLSTLFFSTLKRVARQQRKAMKIASASVAPKPRKPKRTGSKKTAPKRRPTSKTTAPARATQPSSKLPASGKGSWQTALHRTAVSATMLPGGLEYALYRPKDLPAAGRPLVIMLHGCKQTAQDFAQGTRMNRLADSKGFVVAYPQQSKRAQSMQCWRWFQPQAGQGLAEADAIASLARALVSKYRLDSTRIYIAGLSAGAGMAGLSVLRHPDLYAAAALHSGVALGSAHSPTAGLQAMRRGATSDPVTLAKTIAKGDGRTPTIILHGSRDRIVSPRNAIQLAEQFSGLNGATSSKESVLAHGTHREYRRQDFLKDGEVAVRLCTLNEVGHAWSGGDPKFKFHSKKGPSAAVLIWGFFDKHRHP